MTALLEHETLDQDDAYAAAGVSRTAPATSDLVLGRGAFARRRVGMAGTLVGSTPGGVQLVAESAEHFARVPGPWPGDHSVRFFFDRPLCRRDGLETLVRYRLPAFDREAVRPVGKARLRSLDRRQLSA